MSVIDRAVLELKFFQTNTRLDRFFGGAYASQHLDKTLDRARYSGSPHVKLTNWSAPNNGKPSFDEAVSNFAGQEQVIEKGFVFGLSWTNHWVKCELDIPEDVQKAGQEVICEYITRADREELADFVQSSLTHLAKPWSTLQTELRSMVSSDPISS